MDLLVRIEVMKIVKFLRNLNSEETGATAIEYALIATLIAVAAMTAMSALGTSVSNTFQSVSTSLSTPSS